MIHDESLLFASMITNSICEFIALPRPFHIYAAPEHYYYYYDSNPHRGVSGNRSGNDIHEKKS